MYHFAVIALLGLAALKVTGLLESLVPGLGRFHVLTPYVLAVAAAVGMDYSVFGGFGISLRESWMGPWATGFIAGSLSGVWAAVLGYLGSNEDTTSARSRDHGRPRMAA